MLTTFTSYDQIRAVLGLTQRELKDEVLILPMYSTIVEEAFFDLSDAILDNYSAVQALTNKNRMQWRFIRLANLYATYAVASAMCDNLSITAPMKITDGKAAVARFKFDPSVLDNIAAAYGGAREGLLSVYTKLFPSDIMNAGGTLTTLVFASAVGISTDPVTS